MSDKTKSETKSPTHFAYQLRERKDKKPFWNRIGSAWSHSDGNGFTIQLETVPLDGRITLRHANELKS